MNQNDNTKLLQTLSDEQNSKIKEIIALEEKILKNPIVTIDSLVPHSTSVNIVVSNVSDVVAVAELKKKDEYKSYNLFLNILFYYVIKNNKEQLQTLQNEEEFKTYKTQCPNNNKVECVFKNNLLSLELPDVESLLLKYILLKLWKLLGKKIIKKKSVNDIFVEMCVFSRMSDVAGIYCLFKDSLDLYNADHLLKNKMMETKTELILNTKDYQKLIQKYVKENIKEELTFKNFTKWLEDIQKNVDNSFFIKAQFKNDDKAKTLTPEDAQKICDRYCGILTNEDSYKSFSDKQPQSKICKIEGDRVYLCIKNISWTKTKDELKYEMDQFVKTVSYFEEEIDGITYSIDTKRESDVECTQHKLITDYKSLDSESKDKVCLHFENFMKKCKTKYETTCGLNIKTGKPEKGTCIGEEFVEEGKNKECVFVKSKAKERKQFIQQKQKELFVKERQSSKIRDTRKSTILLCSSEGKCEDISDDVKDLVSNLPDNTISHIKVDDAIVYTIKVPKKDKNDCGVNFNNGECEAGQVAGSKFCKQEQNTKKCIPLKDQEVVKKRKKMVKKTKFLFGHTEVVDILRNKEIKIFSFDELLVYIDSNDTKKSLRKKYNKLDNETKKYIKDEFKFIVNKRMFNHNCTLFIANGVPFKVCNPVLDVFEDFGLSNFVNISSLSLYPLAIEEPEPPQFKLLIDGLPVDNQLTELFINPFMSIMELFSRPSPAVPASCCKKTTRINKDGKSYILVNGDWVEELEESKEDQKEDQKEETTDYKHSNTTNKEESQENTTYHDYEGIDKLKLSQQPEKRTVKTLDDDGTVIESQYSSLPDGPAWMFPSNEENNSEEDEPDSVLMEFQTNDDEASSSDESPLLPLDRLSSIQ